MLQVNKNKLKICLLGNMNNNHFALGRYLRDAGYDCHLLLFQNEQEGFLPKSDAYDLSYNNWVRQLEWGAEKDINRAKFNMIKNDVSEFDFIIGLGHAPAFLNIINRKLDVMNPYGWDIFYAPRFRIVSPHHMPSHLRSTINQRAGLKKSKIVHFNTEHGLYANIIKKLLPNSEFNLVPNPIVYAPQYNDTQNLKKGHWWYEFRTIRSKVDFMVVAHARHVWGDPSDPNVKGNDIFLNGWSIFCEKTPNLKKSLILCEYGSCVAKSKKLIYELGIQESVTWFPKMFRKDLMPGLLLADLVAAEFVHSWVGGGVMYEALVAGKPLLMFSESHDMEGKSDELFSIYNAKSSTEVANRLQQFVSNPEQGRQIGTDGKNWYQKNVVENAVGHYGKYFDKRAMELGISSR
ncbi:hypothetical protein N9L40_01285 [Rhodobacteraceae bacterium]|nr:hypothetical protein [Paracoccaceae bacterium]